jgi:RNA polymerase sigma-70 factor, ECF subfamily
MPTDPAQHLDHKERQERFLSLLLPVRNRLVHFARAVTRNRDEANDLVSDTILAALERFEHIRGPEAFLSYLFTIAVRIHRRKRWRGRLFGSYNEEQAASIPDRGTSPDRSADVAMLHRALARLPERQREALVLFEISDLSLEEIRVIQGGSLSGVKSRIVRARQKLAELLDAPDGAAHGYPRREGSSAIDMTEQHGNAYIIYSRTRSHG